MQVKFAELRISALIFFFFPLSGTFHPTEDFNKLIFPAS